MKKFKLKKSSTDISTEELDLFATLSLQNGGKKIQYVTNKSIMWQKKSNTRQKKSKVKNRIDPGCKALLTDGDWSKRRF